MDEERSVTFYPPVSWQRYKTVTDEVLLFFQRKVKKIVTETEIIMPEMRLFDVGFNQARLFKYIKNGSEVMDVPFSMKYTGIDIRDPELSTLYFNIKSRFEVRRTGPISCRLMKGSILEPDLILHDCDALVMIEVIEHIPLVNVHNDLAHAIFGRVSPGLVVMTTPNADFNIMFPRLERDGIFRDPDHKFEWTRDAFKAWCNAAVSQYPAYSVRFDDIGFHPDAPSGIGACSQMAVFTRDGPPVPKGNLNHHYSEIYFCEHDFQALRTPEELGRMRLNSQLCYLANKHDTGSWLEYEEPQSRPSTPLDVLEKCSYEPQSEENIHKDLPKSIINLQSSHVRSKENLNEFQSNLEKCSKNMIHPDNEVLNSEEGNNFQENENAEDFSKQMEFTKYKYFVEDGCLYIFVSYLLKEMYSVYPDGNVETLKSVLQTFEFGFTLTDDDRYVIYDTPDDCTEEPYFVDDNSTSSDHVISFDCHQEDDWT